MVSPGEEPFQPLVSLAEKRGRDSETEPKPTSSPGREEKAQNRGRALQKQTSAKMTGRDPSREAETREGTSPARAPGTHVVAALPPTATEGKAPPGRGAD